MDKLKSRKFWLTVLGASAVLATQLFDFQISEDIINAFATIISVGIASLGAVDIAKHVKK